MSTPPDQPLVPPSNREPAAVGHPPASPYADPPWPQPPPPAWGVPQPYLTPAPDAALRKARTALGWAIGATVGAFLAMVLAVGALLTTAVSSEGDYSYEPLRGQLDEFTDGQAVAGPVLVGQLRDLLAEDGVALQDIAVSCPDTASVTASTVVVCSGDIEDLQWTGVVFFEDREGSFVVLET